MSGLDIHYDLGEGTAARTPHARSRPAIGGRLRVFALLHGAARPLLLNLGEPGEFDITPWADHAADPEAKYVGTWELPAIGAVAAPTAVLIRPDGCCGWGGRTQMGLADALTTWFGPPTAA